MAGNSLDDKFKMWTIPDHTLQTAGKSYNCIYQWVGLKLWSNSTRFDPCHVGVIKRKCTQMPAITPLIWNICSENLVSFLSSSCWIKGFQALQRKKSISFTSTKWICSVVFPVHSFGRRCTVSNLRKGLHRGKSRWTKADLNGPKLAQKTDMM